MRITHVEISMFDPIAGTVRHSQIEVRLFRSIRNYVSIENFHAQ